jgi:hypothetical protein
MSAAETTDFTSSYYSWLNQDKRNRELQFQVTCWIAKVFQIGSSMPNNGNVLFIVVK